MLDREAARAPLTAWLAARMPHAADLVVSSITTPKGGGNSAETSIVEVSYHTDGRPVTESLVLRRQLEGTDLFLNADLQLPWKVMQAFAAHSDVPVPPVVGIEMDRDVLGSPFFLMGKVNGRIVPQFPNYNLQGWVFDLPPEQQAAVWRNGIEMMARIHKVDWRQGFQFLDQPGKGEPGLDQYLAGVEEWYDWAGQGRVQPVADAALDYLKRNRPANPPVSVVWGDAIPANLLFADDLSVASVIDWEVAALGPGEVDLGWWLVFDTLFSTGFGAPRLASLPTREQTIALYEAALGRQAIDVDYFEVLALLRLAIITIRQFDRQVKFGRIPADSNAYLNNPITARIAGKLGLPVPEVGEAFFALNSAATKHQH